MSIFTKEVTVEEYDRFWGRTRCVTRKQLNTLGKTAFGLVGIAGVYGLVGDAHMDLLGDAAGTRPVQEAEAIAEAHYSTTFSHLSPADKFTVQYAGETKIRVDYAAGGNGVVGGFSRPNEDYMVVYNNGCLANTAYDINGGEITFRASGLFFSTETTGEIPTAAAFADVDADNPDMLHIISGHADSVDLRFVGLLDGGALEPADDVTERILSTYGCETGQQSAALYADSTLDYNSLYVSVE